MEVPADRDSAPSLPATKALRGIIRQLRHLSAGTDVPSTHVASAHNGVGYGYIGTPDGDVFFDASAIKNLRFDQLARNMTVEFVLDDALYRRTSSVTVIPDRVGLESI